MRFLQRAVRCSLGVRRGETILPKSMTIMLFIIGIIFVGLCAEMQLSSGWDHFAQKRRRTETRVCMCEPIGGRKGKNGERGGCLRGRIFCAEMLKSCNGDRGRWILISYNLNSEKSLTLTKVLPSWVCANCDVALGKTALGPFSNSYLGEKILTNKQDRLSQVGGTFNWTIFCPKIARNKNHTISRIQSADSECASCNVVHILSPLCRLP